MTVHQDVIKKLEEVIELVKELPQGYQYKVRELCACVETVVGMYDDIQRGIIPEIFTKDSTEETKEIVQETVDIPGEPDTMVVQNEEPINPKQANLDLGNFEL